MKKRDPLVLAVFSVLKRVVNPESSRFRAVFHLAFLFELRADLVSYA